MSLEYPATDNIADRIGRLVEESGYRRFHNSHILRLRCPAALATFRRKKPFSDDRATKLGARTRRQIAAGKV